MQRSYQAEAVLRRLLLRQVQQVLVLARVQGLLGAHVAPQPQLRPRMPDAEAQLQERLYLLYRGRKLLPLRRVRAEPVGVQRQHQEMHTLSSSVQVATSFCKSEHRDRATRPTVQQR